MKEAIILAGGSGFRLQSVNPDLPKALVPIAGKPFLHYLITHLQNQGIEKFIFALGYKHELIEQYLLENYPALIQNNHIQFSIETEPLHTGGAIQMALTKTSEQHVLIVNGDTLFLADLKALTDFHLQQQAVCTLALKPMFFFERYAVVEIDNNGRILSFLEKHYYEKGLINGGVYIMNTAAFLSLNLPAFFSFEKEYLHKYVSVLPIMGLVQDSYFIDIGIPEDLKKAQVEFPGLTL